MVAINSNVEESVALELAAPLDSVGRLDITTVNSPLFRRFNTGTATLVAPNKILTSAHVIDTDLDGVADVEDLAQYSFMLGDNLENPDREVGISQVSLHQSWVGAEENRFRTVGDRQVNNSRFDLAVLTLNTNVTDIPAIPISPNVAELADQTSLVKRTATLVGYGEHGSPAATLTADGLRRAARNVIDSVGNNLIRFDYDSTSEFNQEVDTGINSPSLDGSTPELTPVPFSSPIPIPFEGEIGAGDSGGPLLVPTDLNNNAIVGVASEFIDPNAFGGFAVPGYGSVDIYTALDHPATIEFLEAENLLDLDGAIGTQVVSSQTRTVDSVNNSAIGANTNAELTNSDIFGSQAELFTTQNDELSVDRSDF